MAGVREHHIVSACLLRRWAVDGHLGTFYLDSGTWKSRPQNREAFIRDWISEGGDEAEAGWQRIETRASDVFRALDEGTLLDQPELAQAAKDLFALHFARSRTLTEVYNRSMGESLAARASDPSVLSRPELDAVFSDLTGLAPAGPGARLYANDALVAAMADRLQEGSSFFVERINANVDQMRELLYDRALEIGVATEGEFLIGDDPVVTHDSESGLVGILSGVDLGSADTLLMPFGPHHVLAVGRTDGIVEINAHGVARVNRMQVIAAHEKVYFRVGSGLEVVIPTERSTRGGYD